MTRAFAGNLTLAAHGFLAINAFGLASLYLWAKARLHRDHDLFKKCHNEVQAATVPQQMPQDAHAPQVPPM